MTDFAPSVLLIYTGGTIGMIENPETGALENFNFDHLLKHVPELKRFNYRISSYQFNPPIDSSDMEPAYWAKLVKIINYNYDYFDGFVILHGTDTMAYTASALSFMLVNLSKPEEKPAAPTTKVCPFCQSKISIKATRCPHCTSVLEENVAEEK